MSRKTLQVSVALLIAAAFVLATRHDTVGGEKEPKLTPPAGKLELKDGKGEIKGNLAGTDPKDASRKDMYCKIYTIKLEAGKTYQFDCTSNWDNWLRLEDAKGKELAEDDDSNATTNAQIVFECKTAGDYRIIVTSYEALTTGDFTLAVMKK